MSPHNCYMKYDQKGFGLVELMVALVVGLVTSLAIMEVFVGFEGQKRTTTAGADAQTNGTVALYSITRDLQMAGYGLIPEKDSPLECNPVPTLDGVDLLPIRITNGGSSAGGDSVAIRFGRTPLAGVPTTVVGVTVATNTLTVENNLGCQAGDAALFVNGAACKMAHVTGVSAAPTFTGVTLDAVAATDVGSKLSCLGPWQQFAYDVTAGNLRVNADPRVSGIFSIQAQYGISNASNDNQVSCWTDAVAGGCGGADWSNLSGLAPAVRNRIKAVRIAIIARSDLRERDPVSGDFNAWVGGPAVAIAGEDRFYRYRVFETIIPLRNTVWSKETL